MRECIFCGIAAGRLEASFVQEDDRLLAFMDIRPLRPGHVLIVPRDHHVHLDTLPPGDAEALFRLGLQVAAGLRAAGLGGDGLHLLVNDGRAANQTVPHVHLHVLPRTHGDLWRLVGGLLRRPVAPFTRPVARAVLDEQAARVRRAMAPVTASR